MALGYTITTLLPHPLVPHLHTHNVWKQTVDLVMYKVDAHSSTPTLNSNDGNKLVLQIQKHCPQISNIFIKYDI